MKLKDLKEIIKEEYKQSPSDKLFEDVLELIRNRTRKMSDDDVYEFHEKLKNWMNKLI